LPRVIRLQRLPEDFWMRLEQEPPRVMVLEVEYVAGIGGRQPAMPADDHHVLVVVVRRAETEIVRTSDYSAIVAERIDHHDLIVNDREAEFGKLPFPCAEGVTGRDGAGGNRPRIGLELRLFRALFRRFSWFADDGDLRL
jgi:hypothetical protein